MKPHRRFTFNFILLNISPDHLERHGGMRGYIAAKALVLDRLDETGIAILGGDKHVKNLAKVTAAKGIKALIASLIYHQVPSSDQPRLLGRTTENAAAAALTLRTIRLDDQTINRGISSFSSLPIAFNQLLARKSSICQ